MDKIIFLGIILLFVAIALIFLGSIISMFKSGDKKIESAGIVFIGPVPLGFATNKKLLLPLLIFSVIVFILWFVLRRYI